MKKIALYILSFFFVNISIFAQETDTLAHFMVLNVQKISRSTLKFDLHIERTSDLWKYFANGTFQLTFKTKPESFNAINNRLALKYIKGSSQIVDLDTLVDSRIPYYLYKVKSQIIYSSPDSAKDLYGNSLNRYPLRINIGYFGPQKFINTVALVNRGDSIKLGSFLLSSVDSVSLDEKDLTWLAPEANYYQTAAYKLDKDSIVDNNLYAKEDDNIEMADFNKYFYKYSADTAKHSNSIADLTVNYIGGKKAEIYFDTYNEYINMGYLIVKGELDYNTKSFKIDYNDTILDFRKNSNLLGHGTTNISYHYGSFYDTTQIREKSYYYKLLGSDFDNNLIELDTAQLIVPHSVIVESKVTPNPFATNTTLTYKLDDHCKEIYFKVYDDIGREYDFKIDGESQDLLTKKGEHKLSLSTQNETAQGRYNFVIYAVPLDDRYVKQSKTVIELNILK